MQLQYLYSNIEQQFHFTLVAFSLLTTTTHYIRLMAFFPGQPG